MKENWIKTILPSVGILILILDAKNVMVGASEGIDLCVRVVIPALFPFLFFSILLTSSFCSTKLPTRVYLFILGFLGGYPTGAKCIAEACRSKQISPEEASRLIAYCNNAGPAFLFGIGTVLFQKIEICVLLWAIQIVSALSVGFLTKKQTAPQCPAQQATQSSLSKSLKQAIETMVMICGWVILFRVLLTILSRWVFWLFPATVQTVLFGFFELSNGCNMLESIQSTGLRMILFSLFLSFGGLCVTMQTVSILSPCGISPKHYLTGKVAQTAISYLLVNTLQRLLFSAEAYRMHPSLTAISILTVISYILLSKNLNFPVAFRSKLLYNTGRKHMNTVMDKR